MSTGDYLTFPLEIVTIRAEMEVKPMKKLICIIIALMLLLSACAAPAPADPTESTPQATTVPPVTDPPPTEPPVTEPPATEPPPTDPPELPPVEEPFVPHELFDAAACAPLLGDWTTIITLDNSLQNLEMFTGVTCFTLHYTFTEDGQFKAWADEKEFDNAIDTYEAAMIDHMVSLRYLTFYGLLEYQGVGEVEILNRWTNGPEAAAREDCQNSVAALNLYHRFKRLLREGQYYVNGGKVYTQLSEDSFEANAYTAATATLTLRNTDNRGTYRDICVDFPLIFTKSE